MKSSGPLGRRISLEIAFRAAKSSGSIDECEVRANIRGPIGIEPG